MALNGVFLPIVTPFKDGEVDYNTYQSLIEHYLSCGISGIIPLGTTGEVPVLTDPEQEKIIDITVETVNSRVPILVGLGGNCTDHVIKRLTLVHKYPVDGILSVCPYYNRPGQKGLLSHFTKLSKATDLDILIYNIPYRTGVNMANDTLLKLAELKNIQGVKDSCGDIGQSLKLIADKPDNFSVLTGEDIMFFTNIAHGGGMAGFLPRPTWERNISSMPFTHLRRMISPRHCQTGKKFRPSYPGCLPNPTRHR